MRQNSLPSVSTATIKRSPAIKGSPGSSTTSTTAPPQVLHALRSGIQVIAGKIEVNAGLAYLGLRNLLKDHAHTIGLAAEKMVIAILFPWLNAQDRRPESHRPVKVGDVYDEAG